MLFHIMSCVGLKRPPILEVDRKVDLERKEHTALTERQPLDASQIKNTYSQESSPYMPIPKLFFKPSLGNYIDTAPWSPCYRKTGLFSLTVVF